MYQEVEQFLKSDGYSEDLLLELRELYSDFLNVLRERRKDMEEYDHGIVIAGTRQLHLVGSHIYT